MDECLLFQKLTNQELVLISALDHLENSKDEDEEDELDDESN
jgi:hypothetical protein